MLSPIPHSRPVVLDVPAGSSAGMAVQNPLSSDTCPAPRRTRRDRNPYADPVVREHLQARLDANGCRLDARQWQIVRMRAGLHDGHLYRFDELASLLHVTHNRVRQVHKAALATLATTPDLGPYPQAPAPALGIAPTGGPSAIVAVARGGDHDVVGRERERAALLAQVTRMGDRLGQLRASWLATLESGHTREAYSRDLNQFLDYCVEHDLDPLGMRVPQFNMFTTWLRLQTGNRGRPYSKRTRARKVAAISSFYHHLIEAEAVDRHPVSKKARPKIKRTPVDKVVSRDDTLALIRDAETGHRTLGPHCAALAVELLFTMGLRVTEVCDLDIDQLAQSIGSDGHAYWAITLTVKGGKEHIRAIPEDVVQRRLLPYLAQRPRPATVEDGPALLLTLAGRRLSRHQVAWLLSRPYRAGKLPRNVTPHFGRHTFNRRAEESGVRIEARSRALGHESIVTTQNYGQVADDIVNDPSHVVAATLYATGQPDDTIPHEGPDHDR